MGRCQGFGGATSLVHGLVPSARREHIGFVQSRPSLLRSLSPHLLRRRERFGALTKVVGTVQQDHFRYLLVLLSPVLAPLASPLSGYRPPDILLLRSL